jgi:cytochrome oxidase Cu insertion factor (SCO1/SenC/PrrC family)
VLLRRRLSSRLVLALVAAAGAGTAVGLGLGLARSPSAPARAQGPAAPAYHGQVQWAPRSKRAPAITLRDLENRLVSLRSEQSRTVLLTFFDSHCRKECPLEGRALGQVQRALSGSGVPVTLLVVAVNPKGDTKRSVTAFMRRTHWTRRWRWLSGPSARLRRVWRAYRIEVVPLRGDIGHSVALYVIDPRGYQRSLYLFPFAAREVARDIRYVAATA